MEKPKKYITCKCDLTNKGHHGSRRRNFWGIFRWQWQCNYCHRKDFVDAIESDPALLAQYINKHGDKPSKIIKPYIIKAR